MSTDTGRNYTKDHLRSVLTNPLLRTKPAHVNKSPRRSGPNSSGGLRGWMEDPLDTFKEEASRGTASLASAKLCLDGLKRRCLRSAVASPAIAMAESQPSLIMLNWLWSSGFEETGTFFKHAEFLDLLTIYLVVEQRYEVIHRWLEKLGEQNSSGAFTDVIGQEREQSQSRLLYLLVRAECQYGAGLAGAMIHFIQNHGHTVKAGNKTKLPIFVGAGLHLSKVLARSGSAEHLPPEIYTQFMNAAEKCLGYNSPVLAWLNAYHPSHPSADAGFHYLSTLTREKVSGYDRRTRNRLVKLAIRVAKLYIQQGDHARACSIMEVTQTHFQREVGADSKAPVVEGSSQVNSDAEDDLHALERLSMTT